MSGQVDINSVLADIRSLRAQMQRPDMPRPEAMRPDSSTAIPGSAGGAGQVGNVTRAPGFGELLQQAVNSVSEVQSQASELRSAYVKGEPSVDLAQVMIAAEKSSVAFTALTQVRNKVVQTYEEIMKMPV